MLSPVPKLDTDSHSRALCWIVPNALDNLLVHFRYGGSATANSRGSRRIVVSLQVEDKTFARDMMYIRTLN